MKISKVLFLILLCGTRTSVFADSFLKAQSFPEPFKDISFGDKMNFESKDYAQYAPEYDDKGVCIKNCAFPGLNAKDKYESIEAGILPEPEEEEENTDDIEFDEDGPSYEDFVDLIDDAGSDFSDLIGNYGAARPEDFAANAPAWCTSINTTTKLPLRPPVDMGMWPISSDFGYRTSSPNGSGFHPALDISTPVGTPVYATADGVVRTVEYQGICGGAGWYIDIEHADGLISQYLHLKSGSDIFVKVGDKVKACQKIANSGVSGLNKSCKPYKGPHLDYRVRFKSNKNKYIDILCPCKVSNRKTNNSGSNSLNLSCEHSLFNTGYRFVKGRKRSAWRIQNHHCMTKITDKLPDER